ncbi:MAG: M17 family peptidase N-terminal domain-containing protein [Bryobacterales bacterium]
MKGKLCSTSLIHRPAGLKAKRLLLVGAGPRDRFGVTELRRIAATAGSHAVGKGVKSVAFAALEGFEPGPAAQAIVEGVEIGSFEVGAYKTEGGEQSVIEELYMALPDSAAAGIGRGMAVARGQHTARALANEPGNRLTPTVLAERAKELAADVGLRSKSSTVRSSRSSAPALCSASPKAAPSRR